MLRLATICYSQFWTTMWWNNSFPSCHIGFITTHNQWTTWHVTLKHFRNSWVELVVHETDRHVSDAWRCGPEWVLFKIYLSGSKRWTGITSWWEDLCSLYSTSDQPCSSGYIRLCLLLHMYISLCWSGTESLPSALHPLSHCGVPTLLFERSLKDVG